MRRIPFAPRANFRAAAQRGVLRAGPHGLSEKDVDVYVRVLRNGMLAAPVSYVETRSFP